jgi:hypothetical protein
MKDDINQGHPTNKRKTLVIQGLYVPKCACISLGLFKVNEYALTIDLQPRANQI